MPKPDDQRRTPIELEMISAIEELTGKTVKIRRDFLYNAAWTTWTEQTIHGLTLIDERIDAKTSHQAILCLLRRIVCERGEYAKWIGRGVRARVILPRDVPRVKALLAARALGGA